jgi:histidinol phosphatase-like PHP family hydrolase
MMTTLLSRRDFLGALAATTTLTCVPSLIPDGRGDTPPGHGLDFPVIDFHAHFDTPASIPKLVKLAKQRQAKLGIVEHGGFSQPLSSDDTLISYIKMLSEFPVYKGIQAEGLDWMRCFSKEAVAKLDYVLSDALTFPDKGGKRIEIWQPGVRFDDKQDFMDRYVDFNVRVVSEEPIDILANPTFLPESIAGEYDTLWTEKRMTRLIDAAKRHHVAIEINSRYSIPSLAFLRLAKDAGVKFSFGSNFHGEQVGQLDYSVAMARRLELSRREMFMPAASDRKPILARDA